MFHPRMLNGYASDQRVGVVSSIYLYVLSALPGG